MTDSVDLRSAALWVSGRFLSAHETLPGTDLQATERAELKVEGLLGSERIPRADRTTQLGALVLAEALKGLEPLAGDRVSMLTASMLATAHTNERFERRYLEGKAPEPRAFPFTAPNAAAGELSIATGARGPTLCLVGHHEVGFTALWTAQRWLQEGRCGRALVVVTECLPDHADWLTPPGTQPIECAAALVLEAASGRFPRLRARWCARADTVALGPLLSVGPIAALLAAVAKGQGNVQVTPAQGAALEVTVLSGKS